MKYKMKILVILQQGNCHFILFSCFKLFLEICDPFMVWSSHQVIYLFIYVFKQQTERSLFFKQPIHIPSCLGSGCLYPAISDSDLLFSSPVVPWGETPLPQHTHHPGGDKAGPERRQGHDRKAEGEETLPHYLSSRLDHGERNKSVCHTTHAQIKCLSNVNISKCFKLKDLFFILVIF